MEKKWKDKLVKKIEGRYKRRKQEENLKNVNRKKCEKARGEK